MWKPYFEVDFTDESITHYSIDTRDFHTHVSSDAVEVPSANKLKKDPSKYYHTIEELKALIHRLFTESGGAVEWRFLSLEGDATHQTSNWQLKYIRIYRTPHGFLVCNNDKFIMGKSMLAEPVKQRHLNAH